MHAAACTALSTDASRALHTPRKAMEMLLGAACLSLSDPPPAPDDWRRRVDPMIPAAA